eukprot:jgi/Mesvir1/13927/Mv16048-RA.1
MERRGRTMDDAIDLSMLDDIDDEDIEILREWPAGLQSRRTRRRTDRASDEGRGSGGTERNVQNSAMRLEGGDGVDAIVASTHNLVTTLAGPDPPARRTEAGPSTREAGPSNQEVLDRDPGKLRIIPPELMRDEEFREALHSSVLNDAGIPALHRRPSDPPQGSRAKSKTPDSQDVLAAAATFNEMVTNAADRVDYKWRGDSVRPVDVQYRRTGDGLQILVKFNKNDPDFTPWLLVAKSRALHENGISALGLYMDNIVYPTMRLGAYIGRIIGCNSGTTAVDALDTESELLGRLREKISDYKEQNDKYLDLSYQMELCGGDAAMVVDGSRPGIGKGTALGNTYVPYNNIDYPGLYLHMANDPRGLKVGGTGELYYQPNCSLQDAGLMAEEMIYKGEEILWKYDGTEVCEIDGVMQPRKRERERDKEKEKKRERERECSYIHGMMINLSELRDLRDPRIAEKDKARIRANRSERAKADKAVSLAGIQETLARIKHVNTQRDIRRQLLSGGGPARNDGRQRREASLPKPPLPNIQLDAIDIEDLTKIDPGLRDLLN